MSIIRIAPGYAVNAENVEDVEMVVDTDAYSESHVLVNFQDFGHDLPPGYALDEILAALNGRCYYRKEWFDEVGDIDVCVPHGQNSQHDPGKDGPYRPCLELDPYRDYTSYSIFGTPCSPALTQSWEYQELLRKQAEELEAFNQQNVPPVVLTADQMPLHDHTTPPLGSDHSSTGLIYTESPLRPWWKRLFGIH